MFAWLGWNWPLLLAGGAAVVTAVTPEMSPAVMPVLEMGIAIAALVGLWYLHRDALGKLRDSQSQSQQTLKELAEMFATERRELAGRTLEDRRELVALFRETLQAANDGWRGVVDKLLSDSRAMTADVFQAQRDAAQHSRDRITQNGSTDE